MLCDKGKGSHKVITKSQTAKEISDILKVELYRLIREGYEALQDGRISTIEEVKEKVEWRRKECWMGYFEH